MRQRQAIGAQVQNDVHRLSLHTFGCRVVQKALAVLQESGDNREIAHALKPKVIKLMSDQNGNHVVQKALECVDREEMSFVVDACIGQVSS